MLSMCLKCIHFKHIHFLKHTAVLIGKHSFRKMTTALTKMLSLLMYSWKYINMNFKTLTAYYTFHKSKWFRGYGY
uniref:Uncharacterized protein n=1 Tax=Anguilla anguilla TaxID=7936 RepID=A0A0E9V6N6_ANGAN